MINHPQRRKLSSLRHKKRLTLEHKGKTQFLDDDDLADILGISVRTARGYIKSPESIPEVSLNYMHIVVLGILPNCDELFIDVQNGDFVTTTGLRFNEAHLTGYLWQMQHSKSLEKQVDRLAGELEKQKPNNLIDQIDALEKRHHDLIDELRRLSDPEPVYSNAPGRIGENEKPVSVVQNIPEPVAPALKLKPYRTFF